MPDAAGRDRRRLRGQRPALAADPTGAETVLIDDFCQQYPSHSVGTIDFGPDGMLYVSSGDGASFNWADHGQEQPGQPVRRPAGRRPGRRAALAELPPRRRQTACRSTARSCA